MSDAQIIEADPLEREIWRVCDALKVATDYLQQRVLFRELQALHELRSAGMVERIERVRGLRK